MLTQFTVAGTAPCVRGHFPGMPVVPGAYLLAKLHAELNRSYPSWTLVELKKVKFLAPLLPDQQAELSVDDSAWPRVKVRVTYDGVRVLDASGQMRQGVSGSEGGSGSSEVSVVREPLG